MNIPAIDDTPDAVIAYFHQLGTHLLSHDEEIALSKRIEQGDQNAFNELYCANLRLVVSMAKHFTGRDRVAKCREEI